MALEKLSNIVRSASISETATQRSAITAPPPWEPTVGRSAAAPGSDSGRSSGRDTYKRDSRDTASQRERVERLTTGSRQPHSRNGSTATGMASSHEYVDGQLQNNGRRHDYDVQAMESDLRPRTGTVRNPIPPPIVTVRSEFPTLTRSRQQQPLTCLVTVEVPEGRWRPEMGDLRFTTPTDAPPLPSEEIYSPLRSSAASLPPPQPVEPAEDMEQIAEDLRTRVDSWHGLEFHRYAPGSLPFLPPSQPSPFFFLFFSFHPNPISCRGKKGIRRK